MQLFTSTPSTITEHAPQLPVSQPMWLPVRSRSSRRKWMSSLRASTSRSYVVAVDGDRDVSIDAAPLSSSCAWRARTASTSARCVRYSLEAWTSDGGIEVRRARTASAHAVRRVGRRRRPARRRRSRARRARVPLTRAAAFAMHVPSAPSVTAAKPSLLAGRDRDPRQQLARPDGGHVDAEEELLRGHRRARRPRRRSSSARRPRP